jgi:nicotinamide-nucleotide amidase
MPSAEIVTIGTEILLGAITDTNAGHIARKLASRGVDVYRKTSVGDNAERIAGAVREAAARADLVITTGGLGPTVDDPTRDALALAAGLPTEFRPELWEQIQAIFRRYGTQPTENNRRQAFVPRGATAIENPVGTAPAFIVEIDGRPVIALPGVPREMEHLLDHAVLPWLRTRFGLNSLLVIRTLHSAGLGESLVDTRLQDLETLSNPTVGLAAHAGRVDVRIAAKAADRAAAEALIAPVEAEVRARLGHRIYGADGETLADVLLGQIANLGWRLAAVEIGLGGRLVGPLAGAADAPRAFAQGSVHPAPADAAGLADRLAELVTAQARAIGAEIVLGIALAPESEHQIAHFAAQLQGGRLADSRTHGGHPRMAAERAARLGLDWLRQAL